MFDIVVSDKYISSNIERGDITVVMNELYKKNAPNRRFLATIWRDDAILMINPNMHSKRELCDIRLEMVGYCRRPLEVELGPKNKSIMDFTTMDFTSLDKFIPRNEHSLENIASSKIVTVTKKNFSSKKESKSENYSSDDTTSPQKYETAIPKIRGIPRKIVYANDQKNGYDNVN